MAEEEKTEQEQAEQPGAEETPAEEQAPEAEVAEEAPADEPVAEEPAAEEPAAEEAPPEEAPPEEPAEELGPKQRRKLERSRFSGEARQQMDPEQRATDRAERRRGSAERRRRYRAGRRAKRGEPGSGTPPAERRPGTRKVRQGTVVSSKPDKTITVRIEVARRHPTYEKVVRRSDTLRAHDEQNEAN